MLTRQLGNPRQVDKCVTKRVRQMYKSPCHSSDLVGARDAPGTAWLDTHTILLFRIHSESGRQTGRQILMVARCQQRRRRAAGCAGPARARRASPWPAPPPPPTRGDKSQDLKAAPAAPAACAPASRARHTSSAACSAGCPSAWNCCAQCVPALALLHSFSLIIFIVVIFVCCWSPRTQRLARV